MIRNIIKESLDQKLNDLILVYLDSNFSVEKSQPGIPKITPKGHVNEPGESTFGYGRAANSIIETFAVDKKQALEILNTWIRLRISKPPIKESINDLDFEYMIDVIVIELKKKGYCTANVEDSVMAVNDTSIILAEIRIDHKGKLYIAYRVYKDYNYINEVRSTVFTEQGVRGSIDWADSLAPHTNEMFMSFYKADPTLVDFICKMINKNNNTLDFEGLYDFFRYERTFADYLSQAFEIDSPSVKDGIMYYWLTHHGIPRICK